MLQEQDHAIFPIFLMKMAAMSMPITTRIMVIKAYPIPWFTAASVIPVTHCACSVGIRVGSAPDPTSWASPR